MLQLCSPTGHRAGLKDAREGKRVTGNSSFAAACQKSSVTQGCGLQTWVSI